MVCSRNPSDGRHRPFRFAPSTACRQAGAGRRRVAQRYDLMNDLMSFGLHRAWKDALVTAVDPPKNRPFALLDIAGGTGDVAFRVLKHGGGATRATVCDINAGMLDVGRDRAAALALGDAITFAEANAEAL